jgi:anti-sigma-K factor RskA
MTGSNEQPNPTELVAGYILDDLSPEEIALLEQALAEDPAIASEIAAYRSAIDLLPYDLPQLEPPARLKDKIIGAATESITPAPSPTNIVPLPSPRQRTRQWWTAAIGTSIAAVAVAAFGLSQIQLNWQSAQMAAIGQKLDATTAELNRLRRELAANQKTIALVSRPDTQMYSLVSATSTSAPNRATARLLAKPGDVSVTLIARDLPKLTTTQIYRLWAVATPSAAPMYCGQFRQDDSGTARWVAPSTACTQNPARVLITLDAPNDPITTAGPLVMQGAI